jgi:hypothetical protein
MLIIIGIFITLVCGLVAAMPEAWAPGRRLGVAGICDECWG